MKEKYLNTHIHFRPNMMELIITIILVAYWES